MEAQISQIVALVNQLRRMDTDFRVFGADSHRYRVGPSLSEAQLSDFERENAITLPVDYRLYLHLVGNGGTLKPHFASCGRRTCRARYKSAMRAAIRTRI